MGAQIISEVDTPKKTIGLLVVPMPQEGAKMYKLIHQVRQTQKTLGTEYSLFKISEKSPA